MARFESISEFTLDLLRQQFGTQQESEIQAQLQADPDQALHQLNRVLRTIAECYRELWPQCNAGISPQDNHFRQSWDTRKIALLAWPTLDKADPKQVAELVDTLDYNTDWLREIGIKATASLPTSVENLQRLIEATQNSVNPKIYQYFMDAVVVRYTDPPYDAMVNEFLREALLEGGFFVGMELPGLIQPWLDSENQEFFEAVLQQMNPASRRHHKLKQVLRQPQP